MIPYQCGDDGFPSGGIRRRIALTLTKTAVFENKNRPAWLNWLFLGIFLWSSWQLAGMWFSQLHG